jgi:glycerate 2-kinase
VKEGAAGNLPDDKSMQNAIEIKDRVSSLRSDDILLCLITGGGSALLPLPISPITLDEKTKLIEQLSKAGATINELNIVRIALSQVKGGKLLNMARNAHQIFSIIISDVIDDPVELIASGPTIPFQAPELSPQEILDRYNLKSNLPQSIVQVLNRNTNENNHDKVAAIKNSQVFFIGNNRLAIDAAMEKTKSFSNLLPVFLSSRVQGNVIDISEAFFQLACGIKKFSTSVSFEEFERSIGNALKVLHAQPNFVRDLVSALQSNRCNGICIISGGEPTITVKSNGLGGRNQELALRFTKLCHDANTLFLDDLLLLSAGTDGIDGNNDAAGAIGGRRILSKVYETNDENDVADVINDYIFRNDSYNFYKKLLATYAGDRYHVVTGHTGTNVMDLQILMYSMPNVENFN